LAGPGLHAYIVQDGSMVVAQADIVQFNHSVLSF
jgi:hypothetical protein